MAATAPPFNHELGIGTNKWTLSNIDQVKTTYGAALDAGISLFDTAQCYTSSEACLGYVRKRDRRPFIVTKFDSLSGGSGPGVSPASKTYESLLLRLLHDRRLMTSCDGFNHAQKCVSFTPRGRKGVIAHQVIHW